MSNEKTRGHDFKARHQLNATPSTPKGEISSPRSSPLLGARKSAHRGHPPPALQYPATNQNNTGPFRRSPGAKSRTAKSLPVSLASLNPFGSARDGKVPPFLAGGKGLWRKRWPFGPGEVGGILGFPCLRRDRTSFCGNRLKWAGKQFGGHHLWNGIRNDGPTGGGWSVYQD
ncbi:hypothetical protein GWK47_012009 [Chionoecetes opilio]|uniref:Uncharacterized protein n=1 Tax=Chionoecetes opilio TaxID=41210 RepID=A0A8J4XVF2_CHIOP|nr:hypothetical protein GWK47_012009 [Chionoecetes opilio]